MPIRTAVGQESPSFTHQRLLNETCYEGEQLDSLLSRLKGEVEAAKLSKVYLPEKIWFKHQFAIGVNEVTRALERMVPVEEMHSAAQAPLVIQNGRRAKSIKLQAVFLASNCNPKWLTKHLPSLALSRGVPIILVRDNTQSSLRLGEVVKLKTAMALGVKANGNSINKFIESALHQHISLRCTDTTESSVKVNDEDLS